MFARQLHFALRRPGEGEGEGGWKGKPKHMARPSASDDSFFSFLFFYHPVSSLQRHSMKTDTVETSKVWRSSLRQEAQSSKIHLGDTPRYLARRAHNNKHWGSHKAAHTTRMW